MKATFANKPDELDAAASRAGLFAVAFENSKLATEPGYKSREVDSMDIGVVIKQETSGNCSVFGTIHNVMRLIGALADDGQDTLLCCDLEVFTE